MPDQQAGRLRVARQLPRQSLVRLMNNVYATRQNTDVYTKVQARFYVNLLNHPHGQALGVRLIIVNYTSNYITRLISFSVCSFIHIAIKY